MISLAWNCCYTVRKQKRARKVFAKKPRRENANRVARTCRCTLPGQGIFETLAATPSAALLKGPSK